MKEIVRLSLLSALLLGTCIPALSAPSDGDMGFAGPSADIGSYGAETQGNGGNSTAAGESSFRAGATGETTGNESRQMVESQMYWNTGGGGGNMSNYVTRTGQSGDIWPTSNAAPATSEESHGGRMMQTNSQLYKPVTARGANMQNLRVSTGLQAPNTVSRVSFRGPQNLGFRGPGPITQNAQRVLGGGLGLIFGLPATGTGSVNLSITSRNGKD
jgi:hypothetical protein